MEESLVVFGDSRSMPELSRASVDLVVTSPPYFHIKDYGEARQIGFGQTLHQYLRDLFLVWRECRRVLRPGGRLCISIGDQFARACDFGRYKVIPLHAEIILQCERLGFDYQGAIIWQKKTTLRPSGGAVIMGSFPYPPNGVVEIDYEFILLFRREPSGNEARRRKQAARKLGLLEASRLSRNEWKRFFRGHWQFAGARKKGHEAPFPLELPRRLIRMFSFAGETVLDPFLGSGTTLVAALRAGRRCVGYELRREYREQIEEKLGSLKKQVRFQSRRKEPQIKPPRYRPALPDLSVRKVTVPEAPRELFRVRGIAGPREFVLDDGRRVGLRGIQVAGRKRPEARRYLEKYLLGKRVYLKGEAKRNGTRLEAYVYLSNRLFVNRKMIEMGLADPATGDHPLKERFFKAQQKALEGGSVP